MSVCWDTLAFATEKYTLAEADLELVGEHSTSELSVDQTGRDPKPKAEPDMLPNDQRPDEGPYA